MDIAHRISLNIEPSDRAFLASIGVAAPERGFFTFETRESAVHWATTRRWVEERNPKPIDIRFTTFELSEVLAADWCALHGKWLHGYPEPAGDFRDRYFDLTDYCKRCGIGAKQRGALRMKGEPPWAGHRVMQFHWLHDVFFVTPRLHEDVFAPRSIDARLVLPLKGDDALRTVRQLVVPEEWDLDSSSLQPSACVQCARIKYVPHSVGFLPPLRRPGAKSVVRTSQLFGHGAEAFHLVIASQEVVRVLVEVNVRGVGFTPLANRE